MTTFKALKEKPFENIVGKEENAGNQHFLLFPQCFYPMKYNLNVSVTFNLSSAKALNLGKPKIFPSGKG